MRTKPNFKTIDLAAPVWVPKVGEMCEVYTNRGIWARCKVIEASNGGWNVQYEMDGTLLTGWTQISNLREGTAPASKLDQLAVLMKTGKWPEALAMASKFQDLGDHKKEITQGHNANVNPDFYRQIHKDPAALVEAGITALKERYVK